MVIKAIDIFAQTHCKPISEICTTITKYIAQETSSKLTNLQIRKKL